MDVPSNDWLVEADMTPNEMRTAQHRLEKMGEVLELDSDGTLRIVNSNLLQPTEGRRLADAIFDLLNKEEQRRKTAAKQAGQLTQATKQLRATETNRPMPPPRDR